MAERDGCLFGSHEGKPMKVLMLYDYPPPPAGLATQADMLLKGLREIGVEVHAAHWESTLEKEWYYRWFKPDIAVGVGYWGFTPHIILHPQKFGVLPVPWLVADGYIANFQDDLNALPLILVTSNWVKDVYVRDGIRGEGIEVLPIGCDTDRFTPRAGDDPEVVAMRAALGVAEDELLILTIGGDAASKGAQEVMQALSSLRSVPGLPKWRYVCKVWPQARTTHQNQLDLELAKKLGISEQVSYFSGRNSRDILPYLLAACDIYAAPSRLEGFGMPQVEAGACAKPVLGIAAMGMLDTLVDGETACLAAVGVENRISETVLGPESGFPERRKVHFDPPRIADYRADVEDLRRCLLSLISDPELRRRLGEAGRQRVVEHYDYRLIARRFVEIIGRRLGIS
jgi:starch synthase